MTVEEILLRISDDMGGEHDTMLSMGRKFAAYFITLEIDGESFNVFAEQSSDQGVLGGGILKNLGLSPEYSYSGAKNRYSLRIKQKNKNPFVSLLIAIAAAVPVGSLGYLLPGDACDLLLDNVLVPLNNAFLDLLGAIAGPMIFLSVAWGIYGVGDAATLKNIGKRLCLSYIGTMTIVSAIICWLAIPLFRLDFSAATENGSSLTAILTLILGIIPKDIFSPFVNGNTLQIIFIAVVIGIAMLFLGQKTDFVAKIVEQINYIVQFLIEAISGLVPYFIFIMVLKIIWSDMLGTLSQIGKLVGVFIGGALLSTVLIVGYTALKNRTSPILLVKKGLPTLAIAITTASSAAAFGTNMRTAQKEYGIDGKLCSFGIPLGIVTYKPVNAINYILQSMFFAELYGIRISASWIAVMLITSVILKVHRRIGSYRSSGVFV